MAMPTVTADVVQRLWEANAEIDKIQAAAGPAALFLQTTPVVELNATAIEIETVKGYEFVAASVRRNQNSTMQSTHVNSLGNAEAAVRQFPLIKEEFEIPGTKLLNRVLGVEKPYAVWDNSARLLYYFMQYTKELTKMHVRRAGVFAAEMLNSGKVTCADGVLDFQRDATLKDRVVGTSWATTASCDPLKNIGDTQLAIRAKSKFGAFGTPVAIFGQNAWNNFSKKMEAYNGLKEISINKINLDVLRPGPISLNFMSEAGFVYQGYVVSSAGLKTECYTYPEYYDTDAGVSTAYIATDTCIVMFYEPSIFKTYFGPGEGVADPNYYSSVLSGSISDVQISTGMVAVGGAMIPAEALRLTLFPLGRGRGHGGSLESAPLPVVKNIDVVATIATTTAA